MDVESILLKIEECKNTWPNRVYKELRVGDELYRNLHPSMFMYVIDSVDLDLDICSRSLGEQEFVQGLSKLVRFNSEAWRTLFIPSQRNKEGKMICPLSVALQKGFGECLEKSLLFHLHEQGNNREVYTVWGLLQYYDSSLHRDFSYAHAWNVVSRYEGGQQGMYIVDMQNPLLSTYRKDDRMCTRGGEVEVIPFVQQISGIKEGKFILPHFRKWSYRFAL